LAVDTLGLLIAVVVHAANLSDKVGVWQVLRRIPFFSRWRRLLVDAGYDTAANVHKAKEWFGID